MKKKTLKELRVARFQEMLKAAKETAEETVLEIKPKKASKKTNKEEK